MSDIVALRKDAVEAATKAVELDNNEKFEEASKFYIKAADKLSYLSKIDENPNNKETYKKKAMEYVDRATTLKKSLAENEKRTPVSSDG